VQVVATVVLKGMEEVLLMDTILNSELLQNVAPDTATLSGALPPTRYARHGLSNPFFDPLVWYLADAVMQGSGRIYSWEYKNEYIDEDGGGLGDGYYYGYALPDGRNTGRGYNSAYGNAFGCGYGFSGSRLRRALHF
jgi:hypothetical protein